MVSLRVGWIPEKKKWNKYDNVCAIWYFNAAEYVTATEICDSILYVGPLTQKCVYISCLKVYQDRNWKPLLIMWTVHSFSQNEIGLFFRNKLCRMPQTILFHGESDVLLLFKLFVNKVLDLL